MMTLHRCTVEKVYKSGLVDVRSDKGRMFERINLASSGAENYIDLGDQCLVVSDSSQYFVIGKVVDPYIKPDGSVSARTKTDFSLDDAKSIIVKDEFGNESKIILSKGGGFIVDTGEVCVSHWNPGVNMLSHFLERYELITPGHTVKIDHEEVEYIWRTQIDNEAVDRDITNDPDPQKDIGNTIRVNIGPADDLLSIKTRNEGDVKTEFTIDPQGNVTLHTDGDFKVNAKSLAMGNQSTELMQVVDEALTALAGSPMLQEKTAVFAALKNRLLAIKGTL